MKLLELTRKLYRLSAKMNLYISLCQKGSIDIHRLKNEINQIKQVITEIEKITEN